MIYLASPYSHPEDHIREQNFRHIAMIAARMVANGEVVISPIVYGHTLLDFHSMPSDWEFWKNFCCSILYKCDKLVVCMMDGWEDSRGVAEEISIAKDHGIPVEYIKPTL